MIKLVVTDVDGTIVGKDEILHDEMIQFAKELKEAGIYYTIATGRADGLVRDYVEKMDIKIPYIACNGAVLVKEDKILERITIPLKELRCTMERADSLGMSLMYSINGIESAYRETPYVSEQQRLYRRYLHPGMFTEYEWNTLEVDKVIVMAAVRDGSIGEIEELCKVLPEDIGYKRYANKAIDILSREATKEKGVSKLVRRLGLSMEEVLFVGDDLNDIEVMKHVGIGVAVHNAQDQAKAAASYIAEQDCYKGVIEAVRKFTQIGET